MKNKRRNAQNVSKSANETRTMNTRKSKTNKSNQGYARSYKSNVKITNSSFVSSSSSSSSSSMHNVMDSSKSISENLDPYSLAKMDEEDIKIPTKRIKINEKRSLATPIEQNTPSNPNINCIGTNTDPELLGPCEPGTCIELHGIVWLETKSGVLILNVSWRGKSYVGSLMDSSTYHGSPFSCQNWPFSMMNGTCNSTNQFPNNAFSSLKMPPGNRSNNDNYTTNFCTHDNYGPGDNNKNSFERPNKSSETISLDKYNRTPYMNNRPTRFIRQKKPLYHHYYQPLETINNSKSKRNPNKLSSNTTNQSDQYNTPSSTSNSNRYKLRRKRNIDSPDKHITELTASNMYHHNNHNVLIEKCSLHNCEKKFNSQAALHYHKLLGHHSDAENNMKHIDIEKDKKAKIHDEKVNEKENENENENENEIEIEIKAEGEEEESKIDQLEDEEENQQPESSNKVEKSCERKEKNIQETECIEENKQVIQAKEEKIVKEEFTSPPFPIYTEITTMQSSAISQIPTSIFMPPQTVPTTKIVAAPLVSIPVETNPKASVSNPSQNQQSTLTKIQQQRPITNPYIIPQTPVIKKRPIYPQKATLSSSPSVSNNTNNTPTRKTPQIPRQNQQTISNLQSAINVQTQPSSQQALKPIQPRPSPSNTSNNNTSLLTQPTTTQLLPQTTPPQPPQTVVQQRQILPHPSNQPDSNVHNKNPQTSTSTNTTNTVRHRRRRRQISSTNTTKPTSTAKISSLSMIDTTAPPILEQQQEIISSNSIALCNNIGGSNSGSCSSGGSSNGCFNPLVIATTNANANNSPNINVNHNCVVTNSLSPPPVLSPSATLSPPLFTSTANTPVTPSSSMFIPSSPPLLNSSNNTNHPSKSYCTAPSYSSMNHLNVKVPISSNSTSHSPNGKYPPIIKNICPATPKPIPPQRAPIATIPGNQATISNKFLSPSENDRIYNINNTQ